MTWLWLVPVLALVGGAALLWFGLRGRRVDDHPICRKCGFDVFGRPEASNACSECGTDLTPSDAIRIGRRERRGGAVAAGALLLAVALVVGGAGGYAAYRADDWQCRLPTTWLVRELAHAPVRGAAARELSARVAAGKLAQADVDAAVDRILAVQADPAETWVPALGDFIEDARLANLLTADRWQRFARQAPAFSLDVRQRVRHGDPIAYTVRNGPARVGNRTRLQVMWPRVVQAAGGVPLGERQWAGGFVMSTVGGSFTTGAVEPADYAGRLAPGAHALTVELPIEVQAYGASREVIAQPTLRLTGPFELLPANARPIAVVEDESRRAAMEKAIPPPRFVRVSPWPKGYLDLGLSCDAPPVGVGYEVLARFGGRDHPIRVIACPANKSHSWGTSFKLPHGEAPPATIDVIFKPSLEAAARTTRTYEIWGRPIVYKDVPVTPLPAPATAPGT